MVSDSLPARRHSDSMIQKPKAERPESGFESMHTETLSQSSSIHSSSRCHHQRQDIALSNCPLNSEDEEVVEKRMRRRTLRCLQDLEESHRSSSIDQERQNRTPLACPKRITTKKAGDIYVREQRLSEYGTSNFRFSMHSLDFDWMQSEEFQTITSSLSPPASPGVSSDRPGKRSSRVSFDKVEIRGYGIIPGDNPGGLAGAPLTMEWDSFSCFTIDVERYEEIRRPNRRREYELAIPASHRAETLIGLGFSREDIQNASKQACIGRQKRRSTLASLRHYQVHEKMERAKLAALDVITLGYRSHARKSYLKKHCPEHYQ